MSPAGRPIGSCRTNSRNVSRRVDWARAARARMAFSDSICRELWKYHQKASADRAQVRVSDRKNNFLAGLQPVWSGFPLYTVPGAFSSGSPWKCKTVAKTGVVSTARIASMPTKSPTPDFPPRLLTREQAARYCGLTKEGFDGWVKRQLVPGPIPGTRRWDLREIDRAIDNKGGRLNSSTPAGNSNDDFDSWMAARGL